MTKPTETKASAQSERERVIAELVGSSVYEDSEKELARSAYDIGYNRGYKAGVEAAAKVAEKRDRNGYEHLAIAAAIRSLAKGEGQ